VKDWNKGPLSSAQRRPASNAHRHAEPGRVRGVCRSSADAGSAPSATPRRRRRSRQSAPIRLRVPPAWTDTIYVSGAPVREKIRRWHPSRPPPTPGPATESQTETRSGEGVGRRLVVPCPLLSRLGSLQVPPARRKPEPKERRVAGRYYTETHEWVPFLTTVRSRRIGITKQNRGHPASPSRTGFFGTSVFPGAPRVGIAPWMPGEQLRGRQSRVKAAVGTLLLPRHGRARRAGGQRDPEQQSRSRSNYPTPNGHRWLIRCTLTATEHRPGLLDEAGIQGL